jgi:hypothetical protein
MHCTIEEVGSAEWAEFLTQEADFHTAAEEPAVVEAFAPVFGYAPRYLVVRGREGGALAGKNLVGKVVYQKDDTMCNPVYLERHSLLFTQLALSQTEIADQALRSMHEKLRREFNHFNSLTYPEHAVALGTLQRAVYRLVPKSFYRMPVGANPLEKNYHEKVRYAIRRFEKLQSEGRGVLRVGGVEDLETFWALHKDTAIAKGFYRADAAQQKYEMIARWVEAGVGHLTLAEVDGVLAAALMTVHDRAPAGILLFTGLSESGKSAQAGAALYDFTADYLASRGAHTWDIGQSSTPDLQRFRERMGAQPFPYTHCHKTYRPLGAMWQKLVRGV